MSRPPRLARIIPEVDKRHRAVAVEKMSEAGKKAAPNKPAEKVSTPVEPIRSHEQTAADLGIGRRKVEEFRSVQEHGTPDIADSS